MAHQKSLDKHKTSCSNLRLIDCPIQPGNLRISAESCLKRYRTAIQKKVEDVEVNNIFLYAFFQGLLKCKSCPIVKTLGA